MTDREMMAALVMAALLAGHIANDGEVIDKGDGRSTLPEMADVAVQAVDALRKRLAKD